jgi:hypothetical protein
LVSTSRTAAATAAFQAKFTDADELAAHMRSLRHRQAALADVGRILIAAYERYQRAVNESGDGDGGGS